MSLQTATSEKYEKAARLLEFMKKQESIERISLSHAFELLVKFCEITPDPLTSIESDGNPYLEMARTKKRCICF
jgi:hypothetical protein